MSLEKGPMLVLLELVEVSSGNISQCSEGISEIDRIWPICECLPITTGSLVLLVSTIM